MRLVPGLLSGLLALFPASAQEPRALAWERLPRPPWQTRFEASPPVPPPALPIPARAAFQVRLTADGTLAVADLRGVLRLRTGLPGRPRRVWRDGGQPVPPPWASIAFGAQAQGPALTAEFWKAADPRTAMAGLLWIQDDGERTLSLVHPATGRVAFLPLPETDGIDLSFLPEGLEALERLPEGAGEGRRSRRWMLPWMALVPSLLRLEHPEGTAKRGTALVPFPKEVGF